MRPRFCGPAGISRARSSDVYRPSFFSLRFAAVQPVCVSRGKRTKRERASEMEKHAAFVTCSFSSLLSCFVIWRRVIMVFHRFFSTSASVFYSFLRGPSLTEACGRALFLGCKREREGDQCCDSVSGFSHEVFFVAYYVYVLASRARGSGETIRHVPNSDQLFRFLSPLISFP